jgi:hypothetical protein
VTKNRKDYCHGQQNTARIGKMEVKRLAKWEYAVIPLVTEMRELGYVTQKQMLDKYGLEGWELVSTVTLEVEKGFDILAYLKREKK